MAKVAAFGRVYYVDATGGDDGNTGKRKDAAWQTISKVNAQTFYPGDYIVFKRGETWRTRLDPPNSGTAGVNITFGTYGSGDRPVINPTVLVDSGWSDQGSNVWRRTYTYNYNPERCLMDENVGVLVGSAVAVDDEYEWYWEDADPNFYLYIYSTSDPATNYTDPGVEIQVNVGAYLDGIDYVRFEGIEFAKGYHGVQMVNGCTAIQFYDCAFRLNSHNGLVSNDASGPACDGVLVDQCASSYNGDSGISAGQYTTNWIIQNCTSYYDVQNEGYDGGIKCWGANSGGHIVQSNIAKYSRTNAGGIWIDQVPGDACIVRYNLVEDCLTGGIYIEKTSDTQAYYNVCINNASNGIEVSGTNAEPVDGNLIYNNIIVGSYYNVIFKGDGTDDSCTNNIFKNNITSDAAGVGSIEFRVLDGGENDGTNGYGNVYEYNCLGAEHTEFVEWAGVAKDTYDDFETSYGGTTNSAEGAPLFVGGGDYHLQSGSPCRDAGTDVGLSVDYDGVSVPQETNPAIGAYEYV